MRIRIAENSEPSGNSIYIFSSMDELNSLGLNESEKEYISHAIEGEDYKTIRINRFPSFMHLVKIKADETSAEKQKEKLRVLGNKTLRMIKSESAESVQVASTAKSELAVYFAEGMALGAYQFLKYFSDKEKKQLKLKEISIAGVDKSWVAELNAVINGVYKARDLINEPLSFLTATQLAREAATAGEKSGFKVEILNKKRIETLKMGGLLAVNKGSQDPPTFSILEYSPSESSSNSKPIILVGKGVVYDTGGLSLKPTANSMDTMKSDMSGAAAVIGTMIAIAEANLPVHVIGLIPATDNRPGENAYVPGDVVSMHDGSTVEVLNTDAEGRMILADALSYAKKLGPELVVDVATLTGSAAMAIGKFGVVAMGTADDDTMDRLKKSGDEVHERIAEFPFWDDYNELLKSSIADVKNIGGREGGAITAGKFLQRFTDYPWVHLDIAGPAFLDSDDQYRLRGGTGVGVRLLFNFLKSRV